MMSRSAAVLSLFVLSLAAVPALAQSRGAEPSWPGLTALQSAAQSVAAPTGAPIGGAAASARFEPDPSARPRSFAPVRGLTITRGSFAGRPAHRFADATGSFLWVGLPRVKTWDAAEQACASFAPSGF